MTIEGSAGFEHPDTAPIDGAALVSAVVRDVLATMPNAGFQPESASGPMQALVLKLRPPQIPSDFLWQRLISRYFDQAYLRAMATLHR